MKKIGSKVGQKSAPSTVFAHFLSLSLSTAPAADRRHHQLVHHQLHHRQLAQLPVYYQEPPLLSLSLSPPPAELFHLLSSSTTNRQLLHQRYHQPHVNRFMSQPARPRGRRSGDR